jgi:preprotein translocase subunit SecB
MTNIDPAPADDQGATQPQVRVVAQYVRDFSIENPNFNKMLGGPVENPNIKVDVNAGARQLPGNNAFESSIVIKATATNTTGLLYDMELDYVGVFVIANLPQEAMEPFLLVNCPMLLFPFARRIISDMTREAGFPPLLLDPIDFGRMFMERGKQGQGNGNAMS